MKKTKIMKDLMKNFRKIPTGNSSRYVVWYFPKSKQMVRMGIEWYWDRTGEKPLIIPLMGF